MQNIHFVVLLFHIVVNIWYFLKVYEQRRVSSGVQIGKVTWKIEPGLNKIGKLAFSIGFGWFLGTARRQIQVAVLSLWSSRLFTVLFSDDPGFRFDSKCFYLNEIALHTIKIYTQKVNQREDYKLIAEINKLKNLIKDALAWNYNPAGNWRI